MIKLIVLIISVFLIAAYISCGFWLARPPKIIMEGNKLIGEERTYGIEILEPPGEIIIKDNYFLKGGEGSICISGAFWTDPLTGWTIYKK